MNTRIIYLHYILLGATSGLFMSAQGLYLLERGISAWQIGLLLGVYSIVAAFFELPLGIISDAIGRLKVFIISRWVFALGMIIYIYSDSYYLLFIPIILLALAQALNTGTIDAIIYEQLKTHKKTTYVNKSIANFQLANVTTMVIFAALGGFVSYITFGLWEERASNFNLAYCSILAIGHAVFARFFLRENKNIQKPSLESFTRYLQSIKSITSKNNVIAVVFLSAIFGFSVATVENYWQVLSVDLQGYIEKTTIALMTSGYLLSALVGSIISSVINNTSRISQVFILGVTPVLMGISLLIASRFESISALTICIYIFMIAFSVSRVPATVVLNEAIPNNIRSTMQSVISLFFMLGAALTLPVITPIVKTYGIGLAWRSVGFTLLAAFVIFYALITKLDADKGLRVSN